MYGSLTSSITSNVKYSCASTATEDVASAIAVFDFYCSAARAEVVAAGVTDSIAQTYPTAAAGNTGGGGSGTAKPTTTKKGGASGGPSGTGSGSSSSSGASNAGSGKSNGPKPAVIAGAVAGVVVGLALLGVLIWFLVKQSRKKKEAEAAALAAAHSDMYNGGGGADNGGKSELAGTQITAMPPPSPSPSALKPGAAGRTESVSPVSAHGWTPPPHKAELHSQPAPYPPMPPNAAELAVQAQQQGSPFAPPPDRPELTGGQGYPLHELPSPNRPAHAAGAPAYQMPPELMGQQGYVPGYQQGQQTYPMRAQEYNGYGGGGQQYPQEAHGQPIHEFPGQHAQYGGNPSPAAGHGGSPQQQTHPGWPMAELDGRYGQTR